MFRTFYDEHRGRATVEVTLAPETGKRQARSWTGKNDFSAMEGRGAGKGGNRRKKGIRAIAALCAIILSLTAAGRTLGEDRSRLVAKGRRSHDE